MHREFWLSIAGQIWLIFRNQKHNFEHNRLVLGIMLKSIIGNSKSIIGSGLVTKWLITAGFNNF